MAEWYEIESAAKVAQGSRLELNTGSTGTKSAQFVGNKSALTCEDP